MRAAPSWRTAWPCCAIFARATPSSTRASPKCAPLRRAASIFDRELGAFVYADAGDLSAKWRDLYAIVANEKLARGAIEYADLRFQNRIVVKPWSAAATPPPSEGGSSAAALQD